MITIVIDDIDGRLVRDHFKREGREYHSATDRDLVLKLIKQTCKRERFLQVQEELDGGRNED